MIVKICGITRLEDALAAAEEGATAVGFIFVPSSPRYITPADAADIVGKLPPFLCPVGVFVNESRATVITTMERARLRCLQFHGDEPPSATVGYPVPVIKSFRVGNEFEPSAVASYPSAAYLLDASLGGMYGGTGKTFDWGKAREASRFGRIILSGGITPGNVALAARTVIPYAIDVSSGVESSPGVKDRRKIRDFFESLRNA